MLGLLHRSLVLVVPCFALAIACGEDTPGVGGVYGDVPQGSAPHTFAREYCHLLMSACDCPTPQKIFSSVSQCESAMSMQLESDFAEAQAAGLAYDPECMGEYVNLFTQELGCSTRTELTPTVVVSINAPTCKVHYGEGVVGDPCTNHYTAFGDTCEPGLLCQGTCMALTPQPVNKSVGEACDPATDLCELGSYCNGIVCIAQPDVGEACSLGLPCRTGLRCDVPEGATDGTTDGTCAPPPGAGEPCDSPPFECVDGTYCEADVCVAALPSGSPCDDDRQCGPGNVCDEPADGESDVCMAEGPLVCF